MPFDEGDVLNVSNDGKIAALWQKNSVHNALYVTDLCNSKCIMCPQIEGSISRYDECLALLDLINLKETQNVGITGGEPTINIDKLAKVLEKIAKKAPYKDVHILTNGRNFYKIENVEKLLRLEKINLSFGIPLYSDVPEEHDYIVGAKGAFNQTIKGLYNLAKFKADIEIRIVILRQNYKNLRNLANFIYRNLPFVSHVALMAMEYHGNAQTNYDLVSIDPTEYKQELFEAVREFVRFDIPTDVYNLPLCLAGERIRKFCADSISTWKKTFLPECEKCALKSECSGVFETSFVHSEHIKAIQI